MKAVVLRNTSDVELHPLKYEDVEKPEIKDDEVLIRVEKCGVCRTDLHVVEGELPPLSSEIIPGHEAVGKIVKVGRLVQNLSKDDTVGVPWLHSTCGKCEFCVSGRENLCNNKVYTGYTINGGYAEYMTGKEGFVFKLPIKDDNAKLAPLLCAGIIGYRALKAALPRPGARIGFFGFGASAHITLQLASRLGFETIAYSRNPLHIELALNLGATEAKLSEEEPKESTPTLDAALVFAPVGSVVLQALKDTKKGGTVSIAAIHMTPIPQIDYDRYLYGEKKITSVESNTREDALEFLALADRLGLKGTVTLRSLKEANEALIDLKHGRVVGAVVLDCSS
jgi:alcohol dehydrogenase, propanol-preferring